MGELEAGMNVSPTLKLSRLLGKGGMGSVWAAHHLALDTEVAVKFMSSELARKDPALGQRFTREAKAAAKIRNPHAVEIKDFGATEDGTPFIVMELLDGESLAKHLKTNGPMSLRHAALLVTQVAQVLEAAHGKGIVHRDIKPDNIYLVASDYEVFAKVLDFGIAKMGRDTHRTETVQLTETGAMVGTPEYMSPEQVEGHEVDARSDLWSLAVVTYVALTGKQPFTGNAVGAVCIAIAKGTFVDASTFRDDLPPEVDDWFARALTLDRDRRFQSARSLADAFVAAIGEEAGRMALDPRLSDAPPASSEPPAGGTGGDTRRLETDALGAATFGGSASLAAAREPHGTRRASWLMVVMGTVAALAIALLTFKPPSLEDPAEGSATNDAATTSVAAIASTATAAPSTAIPVPSAMPVASASASAEPPPSASALSSVAAPPNALPPRPPIRLPPANPPGDDGWLPKR